MTPSLKAAEDEPANGTSSTRRQLGRAHLRWMPWSVVAMLMLVRDEVLAMPADAAAAAAAAAAVAVAALETAAPGPSLTRSFPGVVVVAMNALALVFKACA